MNSLRTRIFLILITATGLIWLVAIGWIYVGARHEVETVLDSRLQEAARMVASLVSGNDAVAPSSPLDPPRILPVSRYERQLSCQIWSLDGRLVARTRDAPSTSLSDSRAGFSERLIDGETWRIFTIQDAASGIRIMVGDRLGLRERLVNDLIAGLLAPTLLIIPLLGLLIWASLDRGLKPLRSLAHELRDRGADDLREISTDRIPAEIGPVVRSLNGLFAKVKAARQHEREITAFAAHELRTPLAGLRTQAQISLAATDPTVRDTALRQILLAADRTTRLVRQLLALAKLDATPEIRRDDMVNVGDTLAEIIDTLPAPLRHVRVVVDPVLARTSLKVNAELLTLAMRNLHENAVHHMPQGGKVCWGFERRGRELALWIEDEGPGIPDDELPLATNRFFRGRHKSAVGSGLGLAIVELALRVNGARLTLTNRTDRPGLRAQMIWPQHYAVPSAVAPSSIASSEPAFSASVAADAA